MIKDQIAKINSRILKLIATGFVLVASQALAADYAEEWGPKVGTPLPALHAPDQTGTARSLADLYGENGVLILFNRSADW